ncbi:unnamed protein product [Meganyctiphanes norvegica]|uniref:Uncharacterized protein n=1 Tax=Meganyctiphanes norvegica TaxID=48144 RepID=A0AAV2RFS0_MEGNR
MNTFERVARVLKEHLQEDLRVKRYTQNRYSKFQESQFSRHVYDSVFNWIIDIAEFPKGIIHLDAYLNSLDGFSTNRSFQAVVAYACLEGLALRRCDVLNGEWEKVTWIIVKYSTNFPMLLIKIRNKDAERTTKDWLVKFSSPKLCPNPCLRLEFFRFMSYLHVFNDQELFRNSLISTICELHDHYSHLTVDQVPMCSAGYVMRVIQINRVGIRNILNNDHSESKRIKIIMSIVKLTMMLAILEIERLHIYNRQPINSVEASEGLSHWDPKLFRFQLTSEYLSFCGLWCPHQVISKGASDSPIYDLTEFVKIVSNNWLLREYVLDTLNVITNASLCLVTSTSVEEVDRGHTIITMERNKILRPLIKAEQCLLPMHILYRELHGITPPGVHWLSNFTQFINSVVDPNQNSDDEAYDENSDESSDEVNEEYTDEYSDEVSEDRDEFSDEMSD